MKIVIPPEGPTGIRLLADDGRDITFDLNVQSIEIKATAHGLRVTLEVNAEVEAEVADGKFVVQPGRYRVPAISESPVKQIVAEVAAEG